MSRGSTPLISTKWEIVEIQRFPIFLSVFNGLLDIISDVFVY